ncbi:MAG: T9SS type A sorting domain-containing protein [Ignavibacteriales bacterium]|nr:T9SS type A sorting domain-containing protein [Ignavibacteriales bacterium]
MKKVIRLFLIIFLDIILFNEHIYCQVDTLWTNQSYIGTLDGYSSVKQTLDGGYIVTGYEYWVVPFFVDIDCILVKFNVQGMIEWKKIFHNLTFDAKGYCVLETSDSNYFITGYKFDYSNIEGSYDLQLIKTNDIGTILWDKSIGGSSWDVGYQAKEIPEGGFVVIGETRSYGVSEKNIFLIETDSMGDTLWTRAFGGAGDDIGCSIELANDGGYVLAGHSNSYGAGPNDVLLIKTNSNGDSLWAKVYGYSGTDCKAYSINSTSDGGYIIAGQIYASSTGNSNVLLIKTDEFGDTLWTKSIGTQLNEYAYSAQQTVDGGYIISGTNGDVLLIKTNELGEVLWTKSWGGQWDEAGFSVQQTSDNGYVIAGHRDIANMVSDGWLLKTKPDITVIEEENSSLPEKFILQQNYPNPFNPSTKISWQAPVSGWQTLKVYDVLGNEVAILVDDYRNAGSYAVEFNASNLPSGVYFYQLKAGYYVETKKMILLK